MKEIPEGQILFKLIDVADLLALETHVLRYWEREFGHFLKPVKLGQRKRLYYKEDLETFETIRRLLHDERFTLEGAKKQLASIQGIHEKKKLFDYVHDENDGTQQGEKELPPESSKEGLIPEPQIELKEELPEEPHKELEAPLNAAPLEEAADVPLESTLSPLRDENVDFPKESDILPEKVKEIPESQDAAPLALGKKELINEIRLGLLGLKDFILKSSKIPMKKTPDDD
ncbi:MAG: MerR family transcriptional regulator [Deltaproteobacteria bacterium]|jgi:DNA-binding transcriptional MerR regulator|nr:MerR family transcriptional regulator [Deltaproteobacteria bacterium]